MNMRYETAQCACMSRNSQTGNEDSMMAQLITDPLSSQHQHSLANLKVAKSLSLHHFLHADMYHIILVIFPFNTKKATLNTSMKPKIHKVNALAVDLN